jgi:hypothetical protein
VAHNFQTGKKEIKLLTEYESVTQKVLLSVESKLHNAKELQHASLSGHVSSFISVVSGLKIIGHGNPDNNLESRCISSNIQVVHQRNSSSK